VQQHRTQTSIQRMWTPLVGFIIILLALSACGTPAPKVYRVGILSGLDFFAPTADSFKARMAELGYVEGQNIVYDMQKTNISPEQERLILDKFVADDVDLIFTFPTEVSIEAKQAAEGSKVPVVFALAFIEQGGIVNSVREPGGNLTGVRFPGPDLAVKRFEVLLELAPQAKRVWVPYQKGYPNIPPQLEVLRPVAAAAGVTLIEAPFATTAELQADLQARSTAGDPGMDAILMIAEPLVITPDAFMALGKFARDHKLLMGGAPVDMGGYSSVFGVMVDNAAVGQQAATLADKILKGTSAGTIPVVTAEAFLQINYTAAKAVGVEPPEGLLRQAVEVVR
jgi:putative tryptophan/tyrosine transport system substrate-binding protein